MDVINHDLGGARQVVSEPVVKITNPVGEATKNRLVFGRLMSLSQLYFPKSAMAAVK